MCKEKNTKNEKYKRENVLGFYFMANTFAKGFKWGIEQNKKELEKPSCYCYIPFNIVSCVFACELYMKFIIASNIIKKDDDIKQIEIFHGHKLNDLFEKLSDVDKKCIKDAIKSENFEKQLENISNGFVTWRYIYEKDTEKECWNYDFAVKFLNELYNIANKFIFDDLIEYQKYGQPLSLEMMGIEDIKLLCEK